ncbi:MAG: sigma-70 family RNA polymerase sigma factor [Opitutales bacterium]|nr:sigma-70 family RNA polymerase sigma factor [Opitutales bacterium]
MASDKHESFISLLSKHGGMLRGMIRNGVRGQMEVDEVMQRVSLIAWKKFGQLNDPNDFPKWAAAIARFELMKFRRERARDRLHFNDRVTQMLMTESIEETEIRDHRIHLLEECLKELPKDRRELLMQRYKSEASTKELAKLIGRTPEALYQMMSRLRMTLLLCIERKMQK